MAKPLLAAIPGRPGPKGSVNSFCTRCAQKRLPQRIVVKEESEVGVAFRKAIIKALRGHTAGCYADEPVEVILWVYIERQHEVKNGVTLETYVPTSRTSRPIHRNSGDIEKHVRTLHDALQDVALLADDSLVTDLIARKRWADQDHPAGIEIEVRSAPE